MPTGAEDPEEPEDNRNNGIEEAAGLKNTIYEVTTDPQHRITQKS